MAREITNMKPSLLYIFSTKFRYYYSDQPAEKTLRVRYFVTVKSCFFSPHTLSKGEIKRELRHFSNVLRFKKNKVNQKSVTDLFQETALAARNF